MNTSEPTSMEELKCSIRKIYTNKIDKFELLNLANKLKINFEISGQEFGIQKRTVLKALLLYILREEGANEQYKVMLKETTDWLGSHQQSGYSCIFIGEVMNIYEDVIKC